MGHATAAQKAERLNRARRVLEDVDHLPDAVARMMEDCGISRRQAYRDVQHARRLTAPVPVPDVKVPFTVTVSRTVVRRLHAHAHATGCSLSEIVTRALMALLARSRGRG
jgi:predicted DNA-binding transcriptional regulator YafY